MNPSKPRYHRILLKLSGEAIMGSQRFGLDYEACQNIAASLKAVVELGVKIAVVVGGGNIFRGVQADSFGFERTPADQIGMVATIINGLAIQQTLKAIGLDAHVMSAITCSGVVENYHWLKAQTLFDKGGIPIFVGGTGNPYFTTDTAASLRASEIHADVLMKATKVEGIFDKDPLKHSDARQLRHVTYSQALSGKLNVMDATALAMCRENKIPIYVFNLFQPDALLHAILGRGAGSLVSEE